MDLVPLAPRARLLFHLQALVRLFLFWAPMCVGATAGLAFVTSLPWAIGAGSALLVLAFLLSVWGPSLSFDHWGYALRDDDLLIANGWLFRRVTSIPMHRVQHVDTRQGPLEQWFGLTRLQVHTASGMGADGVIPGLDLEDAERLRQALVARAEGDDGV